MAVIPPNNLQPESQPWAKEMQDRLVNAEANQTRAANDVANTLKQLNSSITKLSDTVNNLQTMTSSHANISTSVTINAPATSVLTTIPEQITITLTERRRIRLTGIFYTRQYAFTTTGDTTVNLFVYMNNVIVAQFISDFAQNLGAGRTRATLNINPYYDAVLSAGTYTFRMETLSTVVGTGSSVQLGQGYYDVDIRERA